MNPARTAVVSLILGCLGIGAAPAQTTANPPVEAAAMRNPATFKAVTDLTRREPGVATRVRFEWERVAGVTEYLLRGLWMDPRTWYPEQREYRVSVRNASAWSDARVSFEISLPRGAHSWTLVALHGSRELGDFARPAQVSFDLD